MIGHCNECRGPVMGTQTGVRCTRCGIRPVTPRRTMGPCPEPGCTKPYLFMRREDVPAAAALRRRLQELRDAR